MNVESLRQTTSDDRQGRLDALEAENQRLRRNIAQVYRNRYRRTAYGFATLGFLALFGAVLFPVVRDVLVALGGTGLFAAIVLHYLTPERFVAATVGERIFEALADDQTSMLHELDLEGDRIYVPTTGPTGRTVRLFVPQHADYDLPPDEALDTTFVVPSDDRQRGVAFDPTGVGLLADLRSATPTGMDSDLETVANQLADGIVEVFELARRATVEVDLTAERVSVLVEQSAYGPVDRFDHPVASLLATGLATASGAPVRVSIDEPDSDRDGYLVTCHLNAR